MIEVKQVVTKKQQKEFLNFPLDLYKGNSCFVPPLYLDEKKIFKKDYVYLDQCEAVYYNCYKEGKIVGRISGILQRVSNEKTGENRIRFTRFDSIDDQKVASALFNAVENWGREKGMTAVCGPLGFSDLEREGLLIEGFDELSTFEEQYNYAYYQKLIENCGYEKEIDWVESKLFLPEKRDDRLKRISALMLKKYNLHICNEKSKRVFLKKYSSKIFELLDRTYENIYGCVPFTEGMRKMLIDNFKLIINLKNAGVILDENENVVCLGISFPSIAKAVQKSNGHLTLGALNRIIGSVKNPEIIDLGLVGVDPKYAQKGVSTAVIATLYDRLSEGRVQHCETNLNLEDNLDIINMWKNFKSVQHKRRRSFIKNL